MDISDKDRIGFEVESNKLVVSDNAPEVHSIGVLNDTKGISVNIFYDSNGERKFFNRTFDSSEELTDYLDKATAEKGKDWLKDFPQNRLIYRSIPERDRMRASPINSIDLGIDSQGAIINTQSESTDSLVSKVLAMEAFARTVDEVDLVIQSVHVTNENLNNIGLTETTTKSMSVEDFNILKSSLNITEDIELEVGNVYPFYQSHLAQVQVESTREEFGFTGKSLLESELQEKTKELEPLERQSVMIPEPKLYSGFIYSITDHALAKNIESTLSMLEPENDSVEIDDHYLYSMLPISNATIDSQIGIDPLADDIAREFYDSTRKFQDSFDSGLDLRKTSFLTLDIEKSPDAIHSDSNLDVSTLNYQTGNTLLRELSGAQLIIDPNKIHHSTLYWTPNHDSTSDPEQAFIVNRPDIHREFMDIKILDKSLGGTGDIAQYEKLLNDGRNSALDNLKNDLATKVRFLELSNVKIKTPTKPKQLHPLSKTSEMKKLAIAIVKSQEEGLIVEDATTIAKDFISKDNNLAKSFELAIKQLVRNKSKHLSKEGHSPEDLEDLLVEYASNLYHETNERGLNILADSIVYQLEPTSVDLEKLERKVNRELKPMASHFESWISHRLDQVKLEPGYRINGDVIPSDNTEILSKYLKTTTQYHTPKAINGMCTSIASALQSTSHDISSLRQNGLLSEKEEAIAFNAELTGEFVAIADELKGTKVLTSAEACNKLWHVLIEQIRIDKGEIDSDITLRESLEAVFEHEVSELSIMRITSMMNDFHHFPLSQVNAYVENNQLNNESVAGVLLPYPTTEEELTKQQILKSELGKEGIDKFVHYSPNDPLSKEMAISELGSASPNFVAPSIETNRSVKSPNDLYRVAIQVQKELPFLNLEVMKSFDDKKFPTFIRENSDGVLGLANANQVYINASSNIQSTKKAREVIQHEAMHVGINRILDESQYRKSMEMVWNTMSSLDRSQIGEIYSNYDPAIDEQRHILAEEWLARQAELLKDISVNSKLSNSIEYMKTAIFGGKAGRREHKVNELILKAISSLTERHPIMDYSISPDGFLERDYGNVSIASIEKDNTQNSQYRAKIDNNTPFVVKLNEYASMKNAPETLLVDFTDSTEVNLEGAVLSVPKGYDSIKIEKAIEQVVKNLSQTPVTKPTDPALVSSLINPVTTIKRETEREPVLPSWLVKSKDRESIEKSKHTKEINVTDRDMTR